MAQATLYPTFTSANVPLIDATSTERARTHHSRRARNRSYLLATGSNGSAQLGIGHPDDVGVFTECRFAAQKVAVGEDNYGATARIEGEGEERFEEVEDDPFTDPNTNIISLTSGSSHSLLLVRVPPSSLLSPDNPQTTEQSHIRLYATGTSTHNQLGPLAKPGRMGIIPITRWTRMNVEELLKEAGVEQGVIDGEEGAIIDGTDGMESRNRRNAGIIKYKLKDIACTWTTSLILLSRTRTRPRTIIDASPLESAPAPPYPKDEQEQMDDLLLSFGSNDSGELGIGDDLRGNGVGQGGNQPRRKVWVVNFPNWSEAGVEGMTPKLNCDPLSSAEDSAEGSSRDPTPKSGIRLEIDLLRGSQRNVVCVGRYITTGSPSTLSSLVSSCPGGPACSSSVGLQTDAAYERPEQAETLVEEVIFGWGASRQGQLSGSRMRVLSGIGGGNEGVADRARGRANGAGVIAGKTAKAEASSIPETNISPGAGASSKARATEGRAPSHHSASRSRAQSSRQVSFSSGKKVMSPPTTTASKPGPFASPKNTIRTLRTRPTPFPSVTSVPTIISLELQPLATSSPSSSGSEPSPSRIVADEVQTAFLDTIRIKDIAIGASHTVFLLQDGRIASLGSDKKGQLPLALSSGSISSDEVTPTGRTLGGALSGDVFSGLEWDRVGACWNTTFLIERDRRGAWACGSGHRGQLGISQFLDSEGEVEAEAEAGSLEVVRSVLRKVALPLGSGSGLASNAEGRSGENSRIRHMAFGSEHALATIATSFTTSNSTPISASTSVPLDLSLVNLHLGNSLPPSPTVPTTETKQKTVLYVWGWNEHGNLGLGQSDVSDRRQPVRADLEEALRRAKVEDGTKSPGLGIDADFRGEETVGRVKIQGVWAGCGTSWVLVREISDQNEE